MAGMSGDRSGRYDVAIVASKALISSAELAGAMRTASCHGLPGCDPTSRFEFGSAMDDVA
jgi:hypothetical protein